MRRLWAAGTAIVVCLALGGVPAVAQEASASNAAGDGPPTAAATPSAPPQVGLAWQRIRDRDLLSYPRNGSTYGVISGGPGAIAWGYIYLTGPRIWTTADGRDWSPADVETPTDAAAEYPAEVVDLAVGDPGFVAVGSYVPDRSDPVALVWTSSEGMTWDLIPDATAFDGAVVERVVPWDGGFLVFGNDYVSMDEDGPQRIWASTDGITWTDIVPVLPEGVEQVSVVVPSSDQLWGIVFSRADRNRRITSTDGWTWTFSPLSVVGLAETLQPLPDGLYLTVTAMPKGAGPAGKEELGIYRSTDLATWVPLAVGRALGTELIAVDDTLVMVGSKGACNGLEDHCVAAAWHSTDGGLTWKRAPVSGTPRWATRAWMTGVAALPDGTLVAVGTELHGGDPSTAAWVSVPGGG